jgi:CubicO group peptidase (beta-lactamase class C family)
MAGSTRTSLTFLLLSVFLTPLLVAAHGKLTDTSISKRIASYVDSLVTADQFSGVVLVAKEGRPLFERAYGFAVRETGTPNRTDTKFNVGSINKAFTQIAIYQLARSGKLALTDVIKKFLPDYPNREVSEKVTIEHLLSMTSGIGDFFGEEFRAMPKESLRSVADYFPLFAHKPLEFEPGTGRRYSNGGYIVLGAIIEAVTGTDYHEYVRKNVFEPAGMTETDSYFKDGAVGNLAAGYMGRKESRTRNDAILPARGSPAGGGYSTAGDLLKFTRGLKSGLLYHPRVEADGGLGIGGGAPGINAALEWDARTDVVVIVLSNYDPPAAERVAQEIFGSFVSGRERGAGPRR